MKILFDTHILLWAAGKKDKLSPAALALLMAPETIPLFSAASIWEIVIKASLGRQDFRVDPRALRRGLLDNDYEELVVSSTHAIALAALPELPKDHFDRILVAQAIAEGISLASADPQLAQYPAVIQV